ncbi:MAG: ankyrin repeat domain-containing protein, partial [Planctomycetota bacterium]|nr:ankyrin repeat domain-containing protein [Planctomycetota bacterium]
IATASGITPLHLASYVEAVKALLSAGAEVNAKDFQGGTPLTWATDPAVAEALLAAGADANSAENRRGCPDMSLWDGMTALHWAVYRGHDAMVQTLLQNGANPNQPDGYGLTPLHYAAWKKPRFIPLLIRAGGDVSLMAPLRLVGDNPRKNAEILTSFYTRRTSLVIDFAATAGLSPLSLAAALCCDEGVKTLLRCGVSPNAAGSDGLTPLHWAAAAGHSRIAAILLAHGADATLRAQNGATALDLARKAGHRDVVEILQKAQK